MNTVIFVSLISFVLTVLLMPIFIQTYNKAKISGQQMHEDVKQHQAKAGTPTMGGIVFLLVGSLVALLSLIWSNNWTASAGMVLLILVLYGMVGFLDDFLKVFRRINEGLNPRQKLILQLVGGVLFFLFADNHMGTLNVFGYPLPLGIFYLPFVLFWLVGFSNAVNLTDGIDGLSSISVVISLTAYGLIAVMQQQWDILLIIASMIGGLLGFFLYNRKPARVFMGDVGSLALGGMLAAISMALHQEWTLLLIGLVYVIETASVMLQVAYFKYTRKKYGEGRRIFRMTPFHHHLELGGLTGRGSAWSEWKVDFFLWGLGLTMSLITLALLYL